MIITVPLQKWASPFPGLIMQHLKAMNGNLLWWFYSDSTECLKIPLQGTFCYIQRLLRCKVSMRLCSLMSLLAWGLSRSNKLFLFVVLSVQHLELDWNTFKSTGLIAKLNFHHAQIIVLPRQYLMSLMTPHAFFSTTTRGWHLCFLSVTPQRAWHLARMFIFQWCSA